MKLGRNDPCRCGSGKKYKKCHLDEDHAAESAALAAQAAERKATADREAAEAAEKDKDGTEGPAQAPKDRGNSVEKLGAQKSVRAAPALFRRRAV